MARSPSIVPIRIFITGVTGYIGSTATDLLLNRVGSSSQYSIRALVRSQDKAGALRAIGIEPVFGSLDDTSLLETEASEADVVLSFANADHLPSIQAILKGLAQPRPSGGLGRSRPILIHTSGTGVLLDSAYGAFSSDTIYYDNDVRQLNSLAPDQPHRHVDLVIIDPSLVGKVDTYIVAPPTIWGFGTGPGNHNSIQIPQMVAVSLKHQQAMQIGQGLNVWSKVHVIDLAHLFVSLLERALQEPQQEGDVEKLLEKDANWIPLPKNEDAYYFCQEGEDFKYGDVAKEIAKVFKQMNINDSGTVNATTPEEEASLWPEGSGWLLGGNSRSRAVKGRDFLAWEPKYTDFAAYISEEVHRQFKAKK